MLNKPDLFLNKTKEKIFTASLTFIQKYTGSSIGYGSVIYKVLSADGSKEFARVKLVYTGNDDTSTKRNIIQVDSSGFKIQYYRSSSSDDPGSKINSITNLVNLTAKNNIYYPTSETCSLTANWSS